MPLTIENEGVKANIKASVGSVEAGVTGRLTPTSQYVPLRLDGFEETDPSIEGGYLYVDNGKKSYKLAVESIGRTEETDPTVPAWAKAETKPTYTKEEVGLGNVDNTADANKNVNSAKKDGKGNVIADTYATKSELESGLAGAGKVDDVRGSDGVSVVTDKVAIVTKSAVGLSNVDNTSDLAKPISNATQSALDKKVDKVDGKQLSTNDYTTADKNKLGGLATDTVRYGSQTLTDAQKAQARTNIGATTKGEIDTELEKKLDKTGGTVSGDLTVGGNLKVNGEVTEFKSTTLLVADKLVEVAKGNVEALTSPAGIIVEKADGTNDYGIVVDETNTFMVGKAVKDSNGNIDTNASDLHPVVTRSALIDDKLVKWNGKDQRLEPDQSKYAKSDEDELIAGDWTFTNQNGFKTNKIENVNGNSAYEFVDDTINRYGSTQVPLQFAGSNDRPKYTKDGTTFKEIALLEDLSGTSEAENAKNVTDTINGKNISDIFEENGTTVKNATNANTATRATVATRAENVDTANVANRVANALRISGQNENGTEQTFDFNGSAIGEVAFDENDFNTTKTDGVMAVELRETGVLDGETYSAVRVDGKGRVTQGGKSIEIGTKGQTAPSDLLIVGGLFLECVEEL